MQFIASKRGECTRFFGDYLPSSAKTLYIGTLGFNDICLYFPGELSQFPNVDYLFLIEERPEVSDILKQVANRNKAELERLLGGRTLSFKTVQIVADDTANVAGRSAAKVCNAAMEGYSDVFVDGSSMSRGVCFPIVRQAYDLAKKPGGINAHLLIAGRNENHIRATAMSNDAPHYVHGFQADMNLDVATDALKLWIPQLTKGLGASMNRIFGALNPEEICPILPFPSYDPRRGDKLMKEYQLALLDSWDVNLQDLIYAHESDPTDVCETITRIHLSRKEAFEKSTLRPPRTILSPSGSRIGGIGMLLAALRLDLPIMYEESIGYTSDLEVVPPLIPGEPDHVWHLWLRK
jgi:hypothetical protein